jgi:hypothetical protein
MAGKRKMQEQFSALLAVPHGLILAIRWWLSSILDEYVQAVIFPQRTFTS